MKTGRKRAEIGIGSGGEEKNLCLDTEVVDLEADAAKDQSVESDRGIEWKRIEGARGNWGFISI